MQCSLLGQLPTADPAQLGTWLIVFAAVLAILHLGTQVYDRLWGKSPVPAPPPQIIVQQSPAPAAYATEVALSEFKEATRQQFVELRGSLNAVHSRVDAMRREVSHEIEAAVERLEEKVDGHSDRLARVETKVDVTNERLGELLDELKRRD